ncbi:MAG TPA: peptide chain release factor N(5)-glutamine methyltransferase, partial [Burkholderiales bacterium]|nr:peptide chain release factor N(5)-glutamine methyltransferase [Burkholderiales bacterium]
IARRNAVRLGLEVDWRHGRWCEPLGEERYELIVANPPYVAAGDPHLAALAHEPAHALVAGSDGLDAIRAIAAQAPRQLQAGGWLLIEHGQGQDAAVRELLERARLQDVRTWPDLAGIARVSGGRR